MSTTSDIVLAANRSLRIDSLHDISDALGASFGSVTLVIQDFASHDERFAGLARGHAAHPTVRRALHGRRIDLVEHAASELTATKHDL